MTIRLLLVDDHEVLREGLCLLFRDQQDIEVVGQASDGNRAIQLAKELSPDIILMDITMGEPSGIDATKKLRTECPSAKIIALSVHSTDPFVSSMLEAGASGYVVKGSSFREILEAIRVVLQGQTYLSPAVAGALVDKLVHPLGAKQPDGTRSLSPREREVLQLLAAGKSTKQVAYETGISVRTVETHRQHIMEKLGIDNLVELTKYAIREGLADLEE